MKIHKIIDIVLYVFIIFVLRFTMQWRNYAGGTGAVSMGLKGFKHVGIHSYFFKF